MNDSDEEFLVYSNNEDEELPKRAVDNQLLQAAADCGTLDELLEVYTSRVTKIIDDALNKGKGRSTSVITNNVTTTVSSDPEDNATLTKSQQQVIEQQLLQQHEEYQDTIAAMAHAFPAHLKIDVLEVGTTAGQANLAQAVKAKNGNHVSWSRHDYDLSDKRGYDKACRDLIQLRPRHLVLTPTSSCFVDNTALQDTANQSQVQQRRLVNGKRIWRNNVKLALQQITLGGHVHLHHPESSRAWEIMAKEDPNTAELLRTTHRVHHNECHDGLKDELGVLVDKAHRFQTTDVEIIVACHHQPCTRHTTHSSLDVVANACFCEAFAKTLAATITRHAVGMCTWFENMAATIWDDNLAVCKPCESGPCKSGGEELTSGMGYPVTPGHEFTGTGQWPPDNAHSYPAQHDLLQDPSSDKVQDKDAGDELKRSQWTKLRNIHKSLGHPSNELLVRILTEAGAPQPVRDLARQLTCDVCARFKHTAPARPARAYRPKELGEALGLDLSLIKIGTGADKKSALLLHFVDEASKFHIVRVIKEGISDSEHALGNIDGPTLISELKNGWIRYFQTPKIIHCDSEGVFKSELLLKLAQDRGFRIVNTAGEAHWQLGIVERHIQTITDLIQKLVLDNPADTTIQELCDLASEAKNSFGNYGGFSPSQWQLSRQHPLTRSTEVPPGDEEDEFFQHVRRRAEAAKHFHEAEAKTILRIASLAKARQLSEVKTGDIVYYFRRGKAAGAKQRGTFRGPARVIAVEPPENPESKAITTVWLAHGSQLIRAAPEHLRQATPLEISVGEFVHGPAADPRKFISQTLGTGRKRPHYLDLGARPSPDELMRDDHNDDDGAGMQEERQHKRQRVSMLDPGHEVSAGEGASTPPPLREEAIPDSMSEATSFERPSTPSASGGASDLYRDSHRHPLGQPHAASPRSRSRSGRRGEGSVDLFAPTPAKSMASEDPDDKDMYPPGATPQQVPPLRRHHQGVPEPLDTNVQPPLPPPPLGPEMVPPSPVELPRSLQPQEPQTPEAIPPAATPLEVPGPSTPQEISTTSLHAGEELTDNHDHTTDNTYYYNPVNLNAENANTAYWSQLRKYDKDQRRYQPCFGVHKRSKDPHRIRKKHWRDNVVEFSMDVWNEDISLFNDVNHNESQLAEHFALMTTEAKRHAEVIIRNLTADERKQFDSAKKKEIDQWISHSVFSMCRRAGIPLDRIMTMRWVLTWKEPEVKGGDHRAKARLVVKGFTDPDLTTIRAEAPTLSRVGKHILLQLTASNNWQLTKGDVKTAFLQGDSDEGKRQVYVDPTAEVRKLLGMSSEQIMKLERAVYGLRNAPKAWYTRIRRDLIAMGARPHQLDTCLFQIYDNDKLVGMVGVYVDDCLIVGDTTNRVWLQFRKKLANAYTWSPWEDNDFTFTGVRLQKLKNGSIKMTQQEYCKKQLHQITIKREDPDTPCTPEQLTQLRGADGSLQWLATNSRLDMAAPVSIAQGNHSKPQVKHLQESNKLIRTAYSTSDTPLYIQAIPLDKLVMAQFHDAGQGSRPDGSSQGGYVTVAAERGLLTGSEQLCSILDWKSFKLKRVARSSLSAEVQAFAEALDALEFLKLMLAEALSAKPLNLRKDADKHIAEICPSVLVTDCKSLYDAVERSQSTGLNLAERRTSIEVLSCRERLHATSMELKWVNSDRQLADGLTKAAAAWKLTQFQIKPVWRIVFDPTFTAAKKLKATTSRKSTANPPDPQVPEQQAPPRATSSNKRVPTTTPANQSQAGGVAEARTSIGRRHNRAAKRVKLDPVVTEVNIDDDKCGS